jgi:KTSC domain
VIETHKFKDSDLVASADYDRSAGLLSVTLCVKGTPTYGYAGVMPKTWEEWKKSDSAGRYYNTVIRRIHHALGETDPLGDPIASTYITEDDIPMKSEFDDIISDFEMAFKESDEFDIPSGAFNPLDVDRIDVCSSIGGGDPVKMLEIPVGDDAWDDDFQFAPTIDTAKPIAQGGSLQGVALAKSDPLPQTSSALYLPQERIEELTKKSKAYESQALAVKITNNETLVQAEEVFKLGKELRKAFAEEVVPVSESHYRSYKEAKANENSVLGPLDAATEALSKLIYRERKELERLAAIETQKNLEIAQAEAAKEQQRRTEELKLQLASEASSDEEVEQILSSQEIKAPAIPVFTPRSEMVPPKTSGTAGRKKLVGVVDSLEDLILAVAEGIKAAREGREHHGPAVGVLMVHQPTLNAAAKAKTEEGQLYPGVRVVDEGGMSATRGKK